MGEKEVYKWFLSPTPFSDGLLGFGLLNYQKEFMRLCMQNKRVVGIFSRQSGKTTCLSIFCLWYAITHKRTNTLIIAPTQKQSNLLFNKIKTWILTNPILNQYISRSTSTEIELKNGSQIKALPQGDDGKNIRGETADLIVLEESGYLKEQVTQEVILPMIATKPNAKIIQIGTPWTENHFYRAAFGEDSPYKLHRVPYTIPLSEGLYTKEFIREVKNELTPNGFKREMECEFIESEDAFFDAEAIRRNTDLDLKPSIRQHGFQTYHFGVDVARFGDDETAIIIVEQKDNTAKIVGIELFHKKDLSQIIGRVKYLSEKYKPTTINIDETGLGAGVVDMLKQSSRNIVPYTFTIDVKMDIMDNLLIMFTQDRIKIPDHRKLISQLRDYRYEQSESTRKLKLHHKDGGHDDLVDALALAVAPFIQRKGKRVFILGGKKKII